MQNQTRNLIIVALLALLVVVTCWNQLPGQAPAAKPAAVKWEHMVTSLKESAELRLDEFSDKGWEVCAAYSYGSDGGNVMVIFRRPKAGK
jgi:hypothetical protein